MSERKREREKEREKGKHAERRKWVNAGDGRKKTEFEGFKTIELVALIEPEFEEAISGKGLSGGKSAEQRRLS